MTKLAESVTETEISLKKKKLVKRVPMDAVGGLEQAVIPGYYLRYINTDPEKNGSRLLRAEKAGYEIVTRKEVFGPDCSNPDGPVNASDARQPLMVKLPIEYREEDLKRKADAREAQLKAHGGNLEMTRSSE